MGENWEQGREAADGGGGASAPARGAHQHNGDDIRHRDCGAERASSSPFFHGYR
ncbi:hypothetical protein ACRRTK_018517 [Alexandromys fortis]